MTELRGFKETWIILRRAPNKGITWYFIAKILIEAARAFGVSPGTLSGRIVEVTTQKLKEFKERDLWGITPFAIFIDTIHRANEAFMIALGIDTAGYKHILGFWQGATENHEICEALLADMERRGRNIQKHLAKRYKKEAHRRFATALEQVKYDDARKMASCNQ
ncbi:MAG: transposase [Syntrophorhabdales bacterium]|nr:transposase [Syntrophorhabdales bacterium]